MIPVDYHLPQVSLTVRFLGERAKEIQTFFERTVIHYPQQNGCSELAPRLQIDIELQEELPTRISRDTPQTAYQGYRHTVSKDSESYYFSYSLAPALALVRREYPLKHIRLLLSPEALASGLAFSFHYFFPLLEFLLVHHGIYPLHAAALAGPDGACLLLGHGGAGKTTLALGTWSRGEVAMLSEDRPLMARRDQKVVLLPALGGAKLTSMSYSLLRDALSLPSKDQLPTLEEKLIVRSSDGFNFLRECRVAPVKSLLFLAREQGVSFTRSPLQGTQAFEELLQLGFLVLIPSIFTKEHAMEQFSLLTSLLAQSQCERFHFLNVEALQAQETICEMLGYERADA